MNAIARSACGGLEAVIANTVVVLRPSGALWLRATRSLVVADLHFEKGSHYASRGQMVPPYDTGDTLRRLSAEVAALDPATVVFLGDSFHDSEGESRMAPVDAATLTALALARRLVWVVGNHDAEGPKRLPGEVVADAVIEGIAFRHEPQAGPQAGEAAGHLHPCAKVAGARSVRRRCFVTDGLRIVLPAFGAYAGGLNVRDVAFAKLFSAAPLAVTVGRAHAQPIAWDRLLSD